MAKQSHISVVGEGTATSAPDRCVVRAVLNVVEETAGEAVLRLGIVASRAIDALKREGLEANDLRTTNLNVQDFFDKGQMRVTGRMASYQLEITLRDLERIGEILGCLSDSAGDSFQIHGLQLAVGDPEHLRSDARLQAMEDARRKAAQLAAAAGLRLGPVVTIEEGSAQGGGLGVFRSARVMAASSDGAVPPVPFEPGNLTVTSRVAVTFQLIS